MRWKKQRIQFLTLLFNSIEFLMMRRCVWKGGGGGLMGPVFIFKRKYFNSLCTCVHVFFPIYIKQTDYNSQGYKNWQVGNQHDRVLIYLSIGRNLQQLKKFHGLYKIIIMPDKILIYEDCYFFYLTYWLMFINNNLLNFTNYSW